MTSQESIRLATTGHGDMSDITADVQKVVERSGVRTGIAHVFTIGSTAAIVAIEFEPGLQEDLPRTFDRLMPPSREYAHEQAWHDGNGHSHLQATTLGPSLTVPINDGQLLLGTWQQIVHVECDTRSRERTVVVTVLGD
jgi:secondary thiamine-phosphate synthase enzyme